MTTYNIPITLRSVKGIPLTSVEVDSNFTTLKDTSIALGAAIDQVTVNTQLTGVPVAPTPVNETNTTQIATTAYVKNNLSEYASTNFVSTTYAQLNSPTFTGTPTAPTAATSDNSTTIATTAYVKANLSGIDLSTLATKASPTFTGTPTAPTPGTSDNSTKLATTAYVKNNLASYAFVSSPNFTGLPTAPTPATTDNSTKLATTAFVKSTQGTVPQFQTFSTSTVLTTAQIGGTYLFWGNNITLTLPVANTCPAGAFFSFISNGSGNKVVTSSNNFIYSFTGTNHNTTINLPTGHTLTLMVSNLDWYVSGGTVAILYNGDIGLVQPGAVTYYAMSSPPIGWLKANGDVWSRAAYPALFAAIGTTYGAGDGSTTFKLPDLRGEFIRGWDNGRFVDSGRGFGTAQSAAVGLHSHLIPTFVGSGDSNGLNVLPTNGITSGSISSQSGGSVPTDENRPRNIALLACIKY